MAKKMDWRRAQLLSKPSLDFRYEFDVPDRTERWLRRAESRLQQQRALTAPSSAIAIRSTR